MSETVDTTDHVKGWVPFGELNVQEIELYNIIWNRNINLSDKHMIGYPYGGAIAIYGKKNPYNINIISSSNTKISELACGDASILTVGWSFDENLIVVTTTGRVTEYHIHGEVFKQFQIEENIKLKDCKFLNGKTETIVFFLSQKFKLIIKNLRSDTLINVLSLQHINNTLTCWDCYGSTVNNEHSAMFCSNSSEDKIIIFSNSSTSSINIPDQFPCTFITNICFSFDKTKVALLSNFQCAWLGSCDLKNMLMMIPFDVDGIPESIAWFCNEGLMCIFEDKISLHGVDDEKLSYSKDTFNWLIPEQDGVRIMSEKRHRFIHLIPEQLANVFLCNSDYGSILLDTYEQYMRKEYKAIEIIDKLGKNLHAAIISCIESAGFEWEVILQRKLLKACVFGRSFCTLQNKDLFYNTCRELRIVNNLRRNDVGIPISIAQFRSLTLPLLIHRLKERNNYTFAYELCKLYGLQEEISDLLSCWANQKIKSSDKPDAELADDLIQQLSRHKITCYSSVVDAAVALNRPELAIKLIEFNCSPDLQISTLLKLNKYSSAIQTALSSGDSQLVYNIIFYLREKFDDTKFLRVMGSSPNLDGPIIKYLREFSPESLAFFYNQGGNIKILLGYKLKQIMDKPLSETKRLLKEIQQNTLPKGIIFSAIKSYSNLLERQTEIEGQLNNQLVLTGLSMLATIIRLCQNGYLKLALDVKSEFSIPNSRFYWTAVNALASSKRWKDIDDLYESKKAIVSIEDYLNIYFHHGAPIGEIEKYTNLLSVDTRVDIFLRNRLLNKAAEAAIQSKRQSKIELVSSMCKVGVHDDILNGLRNIKF